MLPGGLFLAIYQPAKILNLAFLGCQTITKTSSVILILYRVAVNWHTSSKAVGFGFNTGQTWVILRFFALAPVCLVEFPSDWKHIQIGPCWRPSCELFIVCVTHFYNVKKSNFMEGLMCLHYSSFWVWLGCYLMWPWSFDVSQTLCGGTLSTWDWWNPPVKVHADVVEVIVIEGCNVGVSSK